MGWYADKTYYHYVLGEDNSIRTCVLKTFSRCLVSEVHIDRCSQKDRIRVYVSRLNSILNTGSKILTKFKNKVKRRRKHFNNNYIFPVTISKPKTEIFAHFDTQIFACY